MGIKVFTGVIPGVACLLGALILIWYPLRGQRLEGIQNRVLHLHQEKKQQLDEQLSQI
jgi:Na+/melibiose symporter-like transporter